MDCMCIKTCVGRRAGLLDRLGPARREPGQQTDGAAERSPLGDRETTTEPPKTSQLPTQVHDRPCGRSTPHHRAPVRSANFKPEASPPL